ncbi:hypothetical protein H2198_009407 [Neophaeococcomyces mojaviensis]|uniref:Uncharacterized protein n=1 Tax=Neophaeococcomyces mojaviensis TaxID=3383035 RepID=A0ACC2ZUR3_9EURO|nr:hypothetical protein H2198_009407 [Knufia sp. JES_112]
MLEAIIHGKPHIHAELRKVPTPQPGDDEVLIKVVATDSNPKDWKAAMGSSVMSTTPPPMNQGDDISGTLVSIGRSVNLPFPIGSRVAAFHRMLTPHGSYAEYAIAPASTTFLIPDNISFEQAAALPLSGMTAALALYRHLDLPKPEPWPQNSGTDKPGVLIYGGASAVGAYALQFVKLSGLSPIITVVGKGGDFVRSLQVTDSNHIIDYRNENVTERVNQILGGKKLKYAFDAISHNNTWEKILEAMRGSDGKYAEGAKLNMVDPPPGDFLANWPKDVEFSRTYVSSAYGEAHKFRDAEEAKGDGEFATEMYRAWTTYLADGRLKPHPIEVQPNGLAEVGQGIQALYDGKVSAKKLVYRIADTPELEKFQD